MMEAGIICWSRLVNLLILKEKYQVEVVLMGLENKDSLSLLL